MKQTWGDVRCLVILPWMYQVTKRTFIFLMNAPLGTIALGASLRRLSIVTVTTHALLVTRVRGGTTINQWWSRLFPRTSTGNIATKAVMQIGTSATTAVDLPSFFFWGVHPSQLGCISLLVVPNARQDVQRGLHTYRLFVFVSSRSDSFLALLLYSWRPSVPSGTRNPQIEGGRVEVCARLRSPRHTLCLAKRVLPATATFALAPWPVASATSPILSFVN